jgi:ubiquinone/menaquinone biosynthesis C-methylase UbiE
MSGLTHERLRDIYDRIGRLQDTQAFYEDRATDVLVRAGQLGSAHRILELGCGTGRFAERLLSGVLPPDARYRGLDISPRMVQLARKRLALFSPRAEVVLTDGSPPTSEPPGSRDRFVAAFVLDLLPESEIADVVREAHRILEPSGLLCISSLTTGIDPFSRLVARTWKRLHRFRPALVGGCRPLQLTAHVPGERWEVRHHARLAAFGIPMEVLVAEPRDTSLD